MRPYCNWLNFPRYSVSLVTYKYLPAIVQFFVEGHSTKIFRMFEYHQETPVSKYNNVLISNLPTRCTFPEVPQEKPFHLQWHSNSYQMHIFYWSKTGQVLLKNRKLQETHPQCSRQNCRAETWRLVCTTGKNAFWRGFRGRWWNYTRWGTRRQRETRRCVLQAELFIVPDIVDGDKFWEPHLLQFLEHVRAGSTLVTSIGRIRVCLGKGRKLEFQVLGARKTYTGISPLSITWEKGKVPSKAALYAKWA